MIKEGKWSSWSLEKGRRREELVSVFPTLPKVNGKPQTWPGLDRGGCWRTGTAQRASQRECQVQPPCPSNIVFVQLS